MTLDIDELNAQKKKRSLPYKQYFGEMDITDDDKKERINLAEKLEEMMLFLFSLISTMNEYSYNDVDLLKEQIESAYLQATKEYIDDSYSREYIQEFSKNVVDTTIENIDKEYYTSQDRAMYVAENEANTFLNYCDYKKAIEQGKTHKQWITMHDNRVRHTHAEVNGEVIGIDDVFLVGTSMMLYPKDESYLADPQEIINCRCSLKYVGNNEEKVESQKEKVKTFTDEKNEWISKSTNQYKVEKLSEYETNGTKYIVDNHNVILSPSEDELMIAEVIGKTFGGTVQLVPRVLNPQGIKTPDYIFRNEKFDLKTVTGTSKNVLYNALKGKKQQANNFIFDISKNPLEVDGLTRQAMSLFESKNRQFVKRVVLVKDGIVLNVFERK